MQYKLYFIVYLDSNNEWQYELDSQRHPTMYQSIQQLKKYLHKYKDKDYRIVEYKLNSTRLRLDEINFLD